MVFIVTFLLCYVNFTVYCYKFQWCYRVKVFVPMALNVRAAFMFAMAYFVMPESEIGC